MKELLKPYNGKYQNVEDTLYYKVENKVLGMEAYIFSEYNYFFSNNDQKIVGKCFYLYMESLDVQNFKMFKTKTIINREFINLGYQREGDHFIVNSDMNIKEFSLQSKISSEQSFDNIFAHNYSCFSEELVVGVSEPRFVLEQLYRSNMKLKGIVDEIISNFQVGIADLGLTGSLALGCDNSNDYDIVFYGNIEELNRIKNKIDSFRMKNGNVREYGLNWPCRYYDDNGNLICCFFVCTDPVYQPLKDAEIIERGYQFSNIVSEDSFSILKAPILEIDDKYITSIIIFNSAFKGVLKKGDKVEGSGMVIKYNTNGEEKYSILCLNPYEEINDSKIFFNRF